jgi:hypothetical protein
LAELGLFNGLRRIQTKNFSSFAPPRWTRSQVSGRTSRLREASRDSAFRKQNVAWSIFPPGVGGSRTAHGAAPRFVIVPLEYRELNQGAPSDTRVRHSRNPAIPGAQGRVGLVQRRKREFPEFGTRPPRTQTSLLREESGPPCRTASTRALQRVDPHRRELYQLSRSELTRAPASSNWRQSWMLPTTLRRSENNEPRQSRNTLRFSWRRRHCRPQYIYRLFNTNGDARVGHDLFPATL